MVLSLADARRALVLMAVRVAVTGPSKRLVLVAAREAQVVEVLVVEPVD